MNSQTQFIKKDLNLLLEAFSLLLKIFFLFLLLVGKVWSKDLDITWELKKDVDSYNVYIIKHDKKNELFKFLNAKTNSATFQIFEAGRYDFKIVPVLNSQEYTTSASSGFIVAKYEAIEIKDAGEEITWTDVSNAASYTVFIKNNGQSKSFETTKPSFLKSKTSMGDTISIVANNENKISISQEGILELPSSRPKSRAFSISFNKNSFSSNALNTRTVPNKNRSFNAYEFRVLQKIPFNLWTSEVYLGYLALKGASGVIPFGGQLTRNLNYFYRQDFGIFIQRSAFFFNFSDRVAQSDLLRYGITWNVSFADKLFLGLKQGVSSGKLEPLEPEVIYKFSGLFSIFLSYFQTEYNVYDSSTNKLAIEYKNKEAKLGIKFLF